MKAFFGKGYDITALDGSEEMTSLASEHVGQKVHHFRVQAFEPEGLSRAGTPGARDE